MTAMFGWGLLVVSVTTLAAWVLVRFRPAATARSQTILAALSFPMLSAAAFVLFTTVALFGNSGSRADTNAIGMSIFAMTFLLVAAIGGGVVLGTPTAIIMVRTFRREP